MPSRIARCSFLRDRRSETRRLLPGYRNRLTQFYSEVAGEEPYGILTRGLEDIERILDEILAWLRAHPEGLDGAL